MVINYSDLNDKKNLEHKTQIIQLNSGKNGGVGGGC